MRKPSRTMPPALVIPWTWPAVLVLLSLVAAFVAFACWFPLRVLTVIGMCAVGMVIAIIAERRRMIRLAADRQGESICSFARSFDCRAVDTWVIRAVFEELQPYCRFGDRVLPLRAADTFDGVFQIDSEDLDDLADVMAYRAGRSMENCDRNPFYGMVETVADLVMFLVHQPLREAA